MSDFSEYEVSALTDLESAISVEMGTKILITSSKIQSGVATLVSQQADLQLVNNLITEDMSAKLDPKFNKIDYDIYQISTNYSPSSALSDYYKKSETSSAYQISVSLSSLHASLSSVDNALSSAIDATNLSVLSNNLSITNIYDILKNVSIERIVDHGQKSEIVLSTNCINVVKPKENTLKLRFDEHKSGYSINTGLLVSSDHDVVMSFDSAEKFYSNDSESLNMLPHGKEQFIVFTEINSKDFFVKRYEISSIQAQNTIYNQQAEKTQSSLVAAMNRQIKNLEFQYNV